LKDKLAQDGYAERTILNMINPSYHEKLIGALLLSGTIEVHDKGWIVVDPAQSAAMLMQE
jgi:hypothetical protein